MCIKKSLFYIILAIASITIILPLILKLQRQAAGLPLIAIANYGPHASLQATIKGIKQEMIRQGFVENQQITYEIVDVGFDASLIPQMISNFKNKHPAVIVALTTPVAQFTKGAIKNIPIVYSAITDPVAAGLLQNDNQSHENITGSSDKQNINLLIQFAKKLLPKAHRVGLLYSTAESNDRALLIMMQKAAKLENMEVISVPVNQARDVPLAMQRFKDTVDFIYVGASGPIQPALPIIAAEAKRMKIPVLNVDATAVQEGLVLASFGVNYEQVGINTAKLIIKLLQGVAIKDIKPIDPADTDHFEIINQKQAEEFGIKIPKS